MQLDNPKDELSEIQSLFQSKKYDLALRKINKILQKNNDSNLLINKSSILIMLERFNEAEIILESVIDKNPKDIDIISNLGIICARQRKFSKAERYYKEAILIDPNYVNAKFNLINLFLEMDRIDDALEELNKLESEQYRGDYYYQLLAEVYIRKLDFSKAKELHQICVKKNPLNSKNFYLLGVDYLWEGDFENSKLQLKKSIEIDPKNFEAFFALSKVENIRGGSPIFNYLKDQSVNKNNSKRDLSFIFFTLYKIMEDENNYEQAFKYLSEANKLRKKLKVFDIRSLNLIVARIKKNYQKFPVNKSDQSTKIPIFILGMPRSGTSLLEQIISNNDSIFGAGELDFMHENFKNCFQNNNILEDFEMIRKNYLDKLDSFTTKKYVVDKLPLNFFWIGYIKKIIPNSKIIHISRNRIDTCFSIYKNLFVEGSLEFSYSEKDIIKFYEIYIDIMNFWNNELGDGCILNINYEDLVNEPEEKTKQIFQYLELKFDSKFINIEENNRWVRTASDVQVRKGIKKPNKLNWEPYKKYLKQII